MLGQKDGVIKNMTNIDYHQLKISKYGLPSWDGLVAPAIEIGLQKEEWRIKELKTSVTDALNLPDNLSSLAYENYPDTRIIVDRIGWVLSESANSGLFVRTRRAYTK